MQSIIHQKYVLTHKKYSHVFLEFKYGENSCSCLQSHDSLSKSEITAEIENLDLPRNGGKNDARI